MDELWKSVVGYEGKYEVSNLGNVKSLKRLDSGGRQIEERILKQIQMSNRYKYVQLSSEGVATRYLVHRLVAMAFSVKKPGCDIVNHIDNNPSNNRSDNLEWTTYKGNMQHAAKQGRMHFHPDNFKKAIEARKAPVIAIGSDGDRMYFDSQKEAAEALGVTRSHIAAVCRKEYGYKTLKGYTFEYKDSEKQNNSKPKKIGMTKEELRQSLSERMRGNTIMVGRRLSDSTKEKISVALGKTIIQYDKNGLEIARYKSAKEATKVTGITHVDDVASGKRRTAGGVPVEVERRLKKRILTKKWIYAAGIRALRTFAQSAIAAIGTTALISEVNWPIVFSTAGLAAVISMLTSVAGLPEVDE